MFGKMDAITNPKIPEEHYVNGHPSILFYTKGKDVKKPVTYNATPRTIENLVKWVNAKSGAFRKIGGGLSADGGRHEKSDEAMLEARRACTKKTTQVCWKELVDAVKGVKPEIASSAPDYFVKMIDYTISALEKMGKKRKWLSDEMTRLGKLSGFDNIDTKQKKDIAARMNVLRYIDSLDTRAKQAAKEPEKSDKAAETKSAEL
eukprot:GHVU01168114.1.p1 GENE.GHVU01168114.1~~GHVU01168114.1.p1  ORF type:complete len:204 (+),score=40.23 GHVU01168114.1:490-1101(+)